jgi:molecular chaperone HscB
MNLVKVHPSTHVCMGCSSTMASPLFCFSCNSIQRLNSNYNYFEVFDLPYSFEMDFNKLEREYNKLASELHPDFYITASSFEKKQSIESAALLNQAFQTLKNPLTRANYLLKILAHGKNLDTRELSDGFLEQMFILQEKLDDFLASAHHQEDVKDFAATIKSRLDAYPATIQKLFNEYQTSERTLSFLQTIQRCLNEINYLQRLLERISIHQAA